MNNDPRNKKLFIFDAGNVSITNISFLDETCSKYGLDIDEIRRDYRNYEFPFYDGFVTEEEYMKHLECKYKVSFRENVVKAFFRPRINWKVIDTVDALRRHGYRTVLGSNTIKDHTSVMLDEMGLRNHYDHCYCSQEMHLSKPDREFFDYILEHEGVEGKDTFFVDDNSDYLVGATKAGIDTFHYYGPDKDERLDKTFGFLYS